jgi:hypothetical protein
VAQPRRPSALAPARPGTFPLAPTPGELPCAARCPAVAPCAAQLCARPQRPAHLGVPCPRRVGPGVALLPLAARSATRAQLGPDVGAARSRHVSAALCACVLAWCAWCFGTTRVFYINKWKLNLEIDYVSYFR